MEGERIVYVEKIAKSPAENELGHFHNAVSAFFGQKLETFSIDHKIKLFEVFYNNVKLDERTKMIQGFKKDNISEIKQPNYRR